MLLVFVELFFDIKIVTESTILLLLHSVTVRSFADSSCSDISLSWKGFADDLDSLIRPVI